MQVTYSAPNRAHHYHYAAALARAGCLRAFVSGFSRFSSRAAIPEVGDALIRADHFQNIYLLGLRLRLPERTADNLAYLSKLWMDRLAETPARKSDVFLFYSGAGLRTLRRVKGAGVAGVVEAVNSHILVQEEIVGGESKRLNLPFRPFHKREISRRVAEYEEAAAILVPSQFVRDSFVAQGIPKERILTVPYGVSIDRSLEWSFRSQDTFRILYVGQIHVRKGLRYLIQAFEKFDHPAKELVIVGPETEVTGIADLPIPAGVKFTGTLKGKELADAYKSATVFVLPTLEEGLALVMGEALSFGLPVIATVNSGAADLFTDGVEGWQVPIRDPGVIVEKLRLLADDGDLLRRMSSAAFERSRKLGGWDAAGELLVRSLGTLVK